MVNTVQIPFIVWFSKLFVRQNGWSLQYRDNVLIKLVDSHRRCLRSRSLLRDICSSRWSFVSCISAARRCAFFLAADSCLLWSSASSIASCSWRGINLLTINKLMNKKYFITNNFFFFRENLILLPQTSKRHQFIKENFKRDRYTLYFFQHFLLY